MVSRNLLACVLLMLEKKFLSILLDNYWMRKRLMYCYGLQFNQQKTKQCFIISECLYQKVRPGDIITIMTYAKPEPCLTKNSEKLKSSSEYYQVPHKASWVCTAQNTRLGIKKERKKSKQLWHTIESIIGPALVIDGDVIRLQGVTISLLLLQISVS